MTLTQQFDADLWKAFLEADPHPKDLAKQIEAKLEEARASSDSARTDPEDAIREVEAKAEAKVEEAREKLIGNWSGRNVSGLLDAALREQVLKGGKFRRLLSNTLCDRFTRANQEATALVERRIEAYRDWLEARLAEERAEEEARAGRGTALAKVMARFESAGVKLLRDEVAKTEAVLAKVEADNHRHAWEAAEHIGVSVRNPEFVINAGSGEEGYRKFRPGNIHYIEPPLGA